jgi:hypothetical protein
MKLYIVPLIFLLVTWGGLFLALRMTKKYRVPQRKSKYSPFSRKVAHTVSLLHLAEGRLIYVKPRVERSQSPGRWNAQGAIASAEEKVRAAKTQLDNDELEAANKLLEEALALIDQAEEQLDRFNV